MSLPIAVIGAGVAGTACAAALAAAGVETAVFDKGRGLGGRLATRRRDGLQWDHGAQYLSARTDDFAGWLEQLEVWSATGQERWHVGVPSQNALVKLWTGDLDVRLGTRIAEVTRAEDGWALVCESGPLAGRFSAVVLTAPAPQAIELLPAEVPVPGLADVVMQPCWTLMVATADPLAVPPYLEQPHADVAWIAADHTKPGRDASRGQYVLQANAAWSRAHLELTAEEAAGRLVGMFVDVLQTAPEITDAHAHRWRYALTEQPLGRPCHFDADQKIGVAGDWCLGHKAEHAYLSGRALAGEILDDLQRRHG